MEANNRTKTVFIRVTPEVEKEFEAFKDSEAIQESIIREFFQKEKYWLEQEMKEIDEVTIKYRAKLMIKHQFLDKATRWIAIAGGGYFVVRTLVTLIFKV